MDPGLALAEINDRLGSSWRWERRLDGGWQGGVSLVVDRDGQMAALKFRADEPERALEAFGTVNQARQRGWPSPEWLSVGLLASGEAWILQEFVNGVTPPTLDQSTAERMIEILDIQVGLGALSTVDMSAWARGVVFEDWDHIRAHVDAAFPGGRELIDRVDRIASTCSDEALSSDDLVHANFSTANSVLDGQRLWMVDVDGVGRGTRAYDAAELLLISSAFRIAEPGGLAAVWAFAEEHLDHREFVVSIGSITLTMANAFIRLDHLDKAGDALPGILAVVDQAMAFVP